MQIIAILTSSYFLWGLNFELTFLYPVLIYCHVGGRGDECTYNLLANFFVEITFLRLMIQLMKPLLIKWQCINILP